MPTINFVGREKELNDFDNFLTAKEEGVFVVIGEIGIGKTLLMKELSNRVKPKEDVIIGFYKLPGVVATHTPFVEVLADLLSRIEERDKSEGTTTFKHIGDAMEEVLKRRKSGFVKALLKDVSKDLKLDATLKFLGRIWKETKTVSAIELAEETIAQHKQEFTDFYLDLLGALVQKTNKKIVLMIDQFERATKSSIDFFLSVVRGLPKDVYMVASFKIGEEARHYEEIGDKSGIAPTLGQIGRIKHRQEKYHEAISALANAASIFKVLESPYFEVAMKDLASIKEEIGEDKFNEILQELDK